MHWLGKGGIILGAGLVLYVLGMGGSEAWLGMFLVGYMEFRHAKEV